jgi:hypothetical protein
MIVAFINSLNLQNWLTIGFGSVGTLFALERFLAARRERLLKANDGTPVLKATINVKRYKDGWRSAQLHLVPHSDQPNFSYDAWRIERTRLMWPWPRVVLARAENDDYATGVFYPENPVREIAGRAEGKPQRFALEFFMKFRQPDDKGARAKFKVTFSHVTNKRRRHTVRVWMTVPAKAE